MTQTTGVFQLPNGTWGFRYAYWINGKQKDIKRTMDENGNPFKTEKAAIKAREAAIIKVHTELSALYYQEERAYAYVESFLKMFYLIFGQAYSRNYLTVDTYNTLCVNKNTKIHMPKMKIDEDTDIVSFSTSEITKLDDYFKDTNAETAYLLGRYCGLRINECYGLKWSNVDFDNDCIHIEYQMQYENGLTDLHSRISQGMREAKKNGTQIGLSKGTSLTTKKSIDCKAIIQKHSKDCGGSLEDPEVIKLCGCSRNSYYKYKRELKTTA